MTIELGRVRELYRYPVKSMAATPIESAQLGWHGLDGDRRFAVRRLADHSGFPWLTASHCPELLLYRPEGRDANAEEPLPTHVLTPAGERLELGSEALRAELGGRFGSGVELMQARSGVFDEATVSVISNSTILGIARELDRPLDRRRFRPNIVFETSDPQPFGEDRWVGGTLRFGDDESGAAVSVTMRDLRCVVVNLDPDTAQQDPLIMRTIVRLNQNNAGVYGTVVRTGTIAVGQRVRLAEAHRTRPAA